MKGTGSAAPPRPTGVASRAGQQRAVTSSKRPIEPAVPERRRVRRRRVTVEILGDDSEEQRNSVSTTGPESGRITAAAEVVLATEVLPAAVLAEPLSACIEREAQRAKAWKAAALAQEEAAAAAIAELERAKQALFDEKAQSELRTARATVSPLIRFPDFNEKSTSQSEGDVEQPALRPDDPVYKLLASEFMNSASSHTRKYRERAEAGLGGLRGDTPLFEITTICPLHNPRLQAKYIAELQEIALKCHNTVDDQLPHVNAIRVQSLHGVDVNEFLLFRGDKTEITPRLQWQGADPRRGGTNRGKMFGLGTYLACKSSKSDLYTEPDRTGERCILVLRTCLGEPFKATKGDSTMTLPPGRADCTWDLDSVVGLTTAEGGKLQYPEYVVYKGSQTLPQYSIRYRHGAHCWCTHCARILILLPRGKQLTIAASYHDEPVSIIRMLKTAKALGENVQDEDVTFYLADAGGMLTGAKPLTSLQPLKGRTYPRAIECKIKTRM